LTARFKAFADALAAATRADLAKRPAALLPGGGAPVTKDDDDALPLVAATAARAARVVSLAAAAAASTDAAAAAAAVVVVAIARVGARVDEEPAVAVHPAPGWPIAEVLQAASSGEGVGKAARAVRMLSSRRCKRSALRAKRPLAMSVRTDRYEGVTRTVPENHKSRQQTAKLINERKM